MNRYIPEPERLFVAKRAKFRCEYCLIFERYAYFPFHIEHIISIKHGGSSDLNNLAFSCPTCNYSKASNVATYDDELLHLIPLYHPRKNDWKEHFEINELGIINSLSKIGTATIKILELNNDDAIEERKRLIDKNLF